MSRHASDGAERKHFGSLKSSASADVSMERKRSTGENQGVGAVDEDVFHQSFVPAMSISAYSSKELTEILGRLKETLSGNPEEWEKRVDALKTLRALLANGAAQFEEFAMLLKTLEVPVDACLRDLRSAVVREACITVAYFSQELKNRFDRFAEAVLQTLIVLLSNSAKIMASSANVAIRFILENTHSPRLFPILVGSLSSKSSVTRKCVCEFLEIIFRVWPLNVLEKHVALLQDSLKKGINDADQEARMFARRAFPLFAAKFPDQANSLLQNLDAQKRKLIEKDLISAGMSGSIMSGDNGTAARSRSNSQTTMAPRSAVTNPVTRRPTRPVLGTVAATVTGARPRPPITTQNEYGTIGRYTRHGSVAPTVDTRSRLSTRKKVSQSQPNSPCSDCERSISEHPDSRPSIADVNQCVVVNFMTNTGLRILPDWDLLGHEAYPHPPVPTCSDVIEPENYVIPDQLTTLIDSQYLSLPARLHEQGDVFLAIPVVLFSLAFVYCCSLRSRSFSRSLSL